jgi:RNA polymerase sigma-70 factor (ECF subfamily)
MAFLVVLDSMTPAERVAFILHDVFRFPFADVGQIVGRTPAACRQLATSARRRVSASSYPPTTTADHGRIVRGFKEAWEAKDITALIAVLDPEATVIADGGGLVNTVLRPIRGGAPIARYYVGLAKRIPTMTMREAIVNGQPGLVGEQDGKPVTVYAFATAEGRITRIWAIRNPEKLHPWTAG